MNGSNSLWINFFAFAAGLLLLIFSGETALFSTIVIILGILFIIPCVIGFIISVFPPRDSNGVRQFNWFTAFSSALGLVFGICLVAVPEFFATAIIYTFGALLILAGLVGIAYLVNAREGAGSSGILYIIPSLIIIAGIVIIVLGRPHILDRIAAIVTGASLLLFSLNGFWAFIRNRSLLRMAANSGDNLPAENPNDFLDS